MGLTVAKLMIWVGAETAEALRGLQGVDKSLDSFGRKAQATGTTLTTAVTLPLIGVGAAAVRTAADFDTNMNVLQATADATAGEMDALGNRAMELGADLTLPGTSAADAAEAMLELSKSGLDVNDVLGASRGVLQLAAAGNLSNARAAEIASNALNAFGLEGSEATRVADLLAAAANASSAEVEDMADSLAMSSAVASSAGISIEDLTAMIGEMANKGIKGSDAGTSLKQMILSLQAPTDKAAGAMADLGISIYDANGNMVPIIDIIGQFSDKLGGLTQEQRNATLATIFGSDAVRAANIVLMGGADAFDTMREAVDKEGAAAELAGARMQGLGGAFESLTSSAETALLAGIDPFKEDIENLARSIAEAVNSFSALDQETQKTIVTFLAVAAGIGPAILAIGTFARGAGAAISLLSGLPALIGSITAAFSAWNAGLSLTTALQVGFGALPVTLGAIAIAAAAVVGVWLQWNEQITKTNEEGRKATTGVWEKFFGDLESQGAGAVQTTDEFIEAYGRMNDQIREGGVAGLFVDKQGLTRDALRELSASLGNTSGDYDTYLEQMTRAAEAAGLVVREVDGEIQVLERSGNITREVSDELGLLSKAEFKNAESVEAAQESYQALTPAMRDAFNGMEDVADGAEAVAENTAAATENLAGLTEAALSAGDILNILGDALQGADWSADAVAQTSQNLSIALGETSAAEAQMQNDVQLLADAFAVGGLEMEQFSAYAMQARDGTLQLDEATRASLQAQVDQAAALRESAAAAQESALGFAAMAESLKGASNAEIARASIQSLGDALREGAVSPQQYGDAVLEIQKSFGLVDEKSLALAGGLPALTQAFVDGVVPAGDMDTALKDLIQDAQDGTVEFDTLFSKYGEFPTAVEPVQQGLTDTQTELENTSTKASETASEIEAAFTAPDWYGMGYNISKGLADGMLAGLEAVEAAAAAVADAAAGTTEEELEETSPSKVFHRIGAYASQGLAEGMVDNDSPILATRQMVDDLVSYAGSLAGGRGRNEGAAVGRGLAQSEGLGGVMIENLVIHSQAQDGRGLFEEFKNYLDAAIREERSAGRGYAGISR